MLHSVPETINFSQFCFVVNRCRLTGYIDTNSPSNPQITLNTASAMYCIYVSLSITYPGVPYFNQILISSNAQPFSSYMSFWAKCTEWPPSDLEHYKVKSTPSMCHKCSQLSNFTRLWPPAVFELLAILTQMHGMTQNDPEHYQVKATQYMCY